MREQSDPDGGDHSHRRDPLLTQPDKEAQQFALLRVLSERGDLSQRELSERLGLSLGKTHYVLHALLDKGLVKVRNFRRSRHKLNYAYVLTPSGLTEKLRLTKLFLRRKEAEFETLQQAITQLRQELDQYGSDNRSTLTQRSSSVDTP